MKTYTLTDDEGQTVVKFWREGLVRIPRKIAGNIIAVNLYIVELPPFKGETDRLHVAGLEGVAEIIVNRLENGGVV